MKNNTFFLKIATNTLLSDNWYEVSKRVAVNDTIRIWMTKLSQNCNFWKLWFLFSCNTHASNESKALSKQNMKSCFNQSQSKFSMNSFPLFDRNFIIIISYFGRLNFDVLKNEFYFLNVVLYFEDIIYLIL